MNNMSCSANVDNNKYNITHVEYDVQDAYYRFIILSSGESIYIPLPPPFPPPPRRPPLSLTQLPSTPPSSQLSLPSPIVQLSPCGSLYRLPSNTNTAINITCHAPSKVVKYIAKALTLRNEFIPQYVLSNILSQDTADTHDGKIMKAMSHVYLPNKNTR